MLGMHGTYEANWAMNQADLIVALGARFDDRVTGRLDAFAPNARKVHVDIDRSSINKTVRIDLAVVADVGHALEDMVRIWKARQHPKPDTQKWWRRINGWRAVKCLEFPETDPAGDHAATRDPRFVGGDPQAITDHHHRGRPASDVGRAALPLRIVRTNG